VLRSGRVSGTAFPKQETSASLARLMIGAELPQCQLHPVVPDEVRLAVNQLSLATADPFGVALKDISLQLHSGEMLGIAGVSGNGQKELLAALSGEQPVSQHAAITLCGTPVGRSHPAQRRALGLRFVPEDRLGRGAVPSLSLAMNALLTGSAQGMARHGRILHRAVRGFAEQVIGQFKVKCNGAHAPASSLSGGNLQKFIVGREILLQPQVLIVAQPTWGVDVSAAQLIRQALIDLRDQGVALLVVSEELDELFMICDRIAVIAEGRLSPAVATADTSVAQIGVWMSGEFSEASAHA
jgi:simple sugar transport system ATP-binding protein